MKNKFILLFLVISLSSFTAIHKFYVSVTEIEYNEKAESLQIISRVFIDDFEELLKKRYDKAIVLGENETKDVNSYIKKYLEQKLQIEVNSKKADIKFLGKEYENDMVILYLEASDIKNLRSVRVKNEVLMDLYEEQKNLIHVEYKKNIKSLILTNGNEVNEINFEQ